MDEQNAENRLREICDDVHHRIRSGEMLVAEAILAENSDAAGDENAALEIIYSEYLARKQLGQQIDRSEYYDRFPQRTERLARLFDIHEIFASQGDHSISPERDQRRVSIETLDQVGHYQILERIGEGGMGVVYRARHDKLGRITAVKMIRSPGAGPDELERFRREAESLASLQHSNIVQVYEVGQHGGCPFLAMEYIDGGSLTEQLAKETISPKDAARLIEILARAVEHAHGQGIVHRDLKPANVLLTRDGVPKLSDFGLAKQVGRSTETMIAEEGLTRTGAIVGTPAYMAPEQAEGPRNGIGPAVDVYSLGAILYEMLTGRPPFRGGSLLDTLRLIQAAEPVTPRRLHSDLPRDLETVCLKCLEKNPKNRYPTAAALAEDLQRFQEGRTIQARSVGYFGRMVKWTIRRPAVAALTASLVAVALVGFAGITWQWRRAESGRRTESVLRGEVEANLYYHRITAAQHELLNHNITRARELLAQCEPRFRQWEWSHLNRLCNRQLTEFRGHKLTVRGAVFSPDGTRLFSVGGDWGTDGPGELKIWNTSTGSEELSVAVPGVLVDIAIEPGGKRFATAAIWFRDTKRQWSEHSVRLWDANSGKEIGQLPATIGNTSSLAFSPDGKQLAAGSSNKDVHVFDLATGKEIHTLRGATDDVFSLAFTPDGQRLAAASRDGTVRVWDLASGKETFVDRGPQDFRGVAFDPDGERLVAVGYQGSLLLWDLASPGERLVYRVRDEVLFGVSFSPDGKYLVSGGSEGQVYVWDSKTMREVKVLRGHDAAIKSVHYSADGRFLASTSTDRTVKVWDMQSEGEPRTYLPRDSDIASLAYSPDGRYLALGSTASVAQGERFGNKAVKIWDVLRAEQCMALDGHDDWVSSVAYNHNGTRLATANLDGMIKIWDPAKGDLLRSLKGHEGPVNTVVFTPNGETIVSGSDDQSIKLWDANTGKILRTLSGHEDRITSICMSPEGDFFASGSDDRTVKTWSLASGDILQSIELRDSVPSVALGPDGQYLAVCAGKRVYLYRANDLATPPTILDGHTRQVVSLTFAPDGQRLVSGSRDGTIKIWDVLRGQEALTLETVFDRELRTTFSPDGRTLASTWGSRLCLWGTDARTLPPPASR